MGVLRNLITRLQDSPGFTVEELGEQQIDGRTVIRLQAGHPRAQVTIWADPETALPVRIEQSDGQMTVLAKNLQFDVPLDESLFRMDVPEGYKIQLWAARCF